MGLTKSAEKEFIIVIIEATSADFQLSIYKDTYITLHHRSHEWECVHSDFYVNIKEVKTKSLKCEFLNEYIVDFISHILVNI